MNKALESRRLVTFVWAGIVSLALYFVAKYAAPAMAEDVKMVMAFVDGLAGILITMYTVDDMHDRVVNAQMQMQARNVENK